MSPFQIIYLFPHDATWFKSYNNFCKLIYSKHCSNLTITNQHVLHYAQEQRRKDALNFTLDLRERCFWFIFKHVLHYAQEQRRKDALNINLGFERKVSLVHLQHDVEMSWISLFRCIVCSCWSRRMK